MSSRFLIQSFIASLLFAGSIGLTHAFTFTNFSSSNLPGRVLGTNGQSLFGARSGSIVAGAYMLATAEFTTVNPVNIANTTILIDGLTGTIVDLGSNTYRARVQMPGNNGVDRYLTVSVPQRDDGVTTGSFASSTGVAGKSVYYLPSDTIYRNFPSRCILGDIGSIVPTSGSTYNTGFINLIRQFSVYCHNVMIQTSITGVSATGATITIPPFTGIYSYINPNYTPLALPNNLRSAHSGPALTLADGNYTIRTFVMTTAGFLASATPRLVLTNITIDTTSPIITVTSTGADTGSVSAGFGISESVSRSVAVSAGTGCTGGAVVQTGNGTGGSFTAPGLSAGTSYCAVITATDVAGNTSTSTQLLDTAILPLQIISSSATPALNSVDVTATANQPGMRTLTLSQGTLCEAPFVSQSTGATGSSVSQTFGGLTTGTPYCYAISVAAGAQNAITTGLVTTLTEPAPTPVPPSNDGGGGGGRLIRDDCPLGDFSPSYYDDTCGEVPLTGNTNTGGDALNPFPDNGSTIPSDRLASALENFQNITDMCKLAFPEYGTIYFNDIVGHPFENNINALLSTCAIQGINPSSFEPDRTVTRGEAIKIVLETTKVVRGQQITRPTDPTALALARYSDLTADYWANPYINAAFEFGILRDLEQPTADGRFTLDPNAPISREDLVRMIQNAAQALDLPNTQIVFTPRDTVSRGELSDAIVRIFNLQKNQAFLATRQNNLTLLQALVTRLQTLDPTAQVTYLTNVRNLINSASSTLLRQLRLDKLSLLELIDAVLN